MTTLNKSASKRIEVHPYRTLSPVPKSKALSKWPRHEITDERTDHEVDLGSPVLVQEVES